MTYFAAHVARKHSYLLFRHHTSCWIPCSSALQYLLLPIYTLLLPIVLVVNLSRGCKSPVYAAAILSQCGSAEALHAQQQDQQQNSQKVCLVKHGTAAGVLPSCSNRHMVMHTCFLSFLQMSGPECSSVAHVVL